MKIIRGPSALEKMPIYGGAADVADGALLAVGVTAGTNTGALILCGADAADVVGVKEALYDYSVEGGDYAVGGTAENLGYVNLLMPGCLLAAEYDLTDAGAAIASMQSTTSIRITDSENTISNFWFYANAGTGIGQLMLVTANDGTDYTIKSAPTTALVAGSTTLTKILVLGQGLHVLSTDRTKLISTAAAGTARLNTFYAEGKWQGSSEWERLRGSAHHNSQLSGKSPAFRSIVACVDGWFQPLA